MNWINAQGKVPTTPRYVVSYINNHFGRRVVVTDNFPHLDGGDSTGATTILRVPLTKEEKVVPALNANGFKLTGRWKSRADGSSCAVVDRT
ncbi:hypothetical protein AB0D13_09030 [Streptomyces sp. NPDC048430]|uniref:hypothetical protein n=1 Tax=Streptomyces sp. NPDC048430 TaxID=3155388 RepID=UPI0034469E32